MRCAATLRVELASSADKLLSAGEQFRRLVILRSLNQLDRLRRFAVGIRRSWLVITQGATIHRTASISLSAILVPGRRGAIVIGEGTRVAFKCLVIAQRPSGDVSPIRIGRHCFIGGGVTILPGVTIGDESIVGAGCVVYDDVPARTIVVGNPARIVRRDIKVKKFGRMIDAGLRQDKIRAAIAALQGAKTLRAIRAKRNCNHSQSDSVSTK